MLTFIGLVILLLLYAVFGWSGVIVGSLLFLAAVAVITREIIKYDL